MVASPEIRPVASDRERREVRDLLRSAFEVSPGVGSAFADLYYHLLDNDPSVTFDCSRVAIVDGQVVGHALLAPRSLHICDRPCPGGLVGLVVVDPEFRGIGLGRSILDDIHQVASEYDLSLLILAGDPGYYQKLGYHQAFSNAIVRVPVETKGSHGGLRPATMRDISRLVELSQSFLAPGSVIADAPRWAWTLASEHPTGLLATNPAILGYLATETVTFLTVDRDAYVRLALGPTIATVIEAGCSDETAAAQLLDGVMSLCSERGVGELSCRLPDGHPIFSQLPKPSLRDDPEFQFRILNRSLLFEAVTDGLEDRILRGCPDWKGTILLRTESEPVLLTRRSGSLEIQTVIPSDAVAETGSLALPEWGIGRLLLGQNDLQKLVEEEGRNSDLDRVLLALTSSRLPSFCLSAAI